MSREDMEVVLSESKLLDCPITHELLNEPVVISCGHTISNELPEGWQVPPSYRKHERCPCCRAALIGDKIPDLLVQQIVGLFLGTFDADRLQQLLQCPITGALLSNAFILSCGHSISENGLEKNKVDSNVICSCPGCKQQTPLIAVRKNFRLNDIAATLHPFFPEIKQPEPSIAQQIMSSIIDDNEQKFKMLVGTDVQAMQSIILIQFNTVLHAAVEKNADKIIFFILSICKSYTLMRDWLSKENGGGLSALDIAFKSESKALYNKLMCCLFIEGIRHSCFSDKLLYQSQRDENNLDGIESALTETLRDVYNSSADHEHYQLIVDLVRYAFFNIAIAPLEILTEDYLRAACELFKAFQGNKVFNRATYLIHLQQKAYEQLEWQIQYSASLTSKKNLRLIEEFKDEAIFQWVRPYARPWRTYLCCWQAPLTITDQLAGLEAQVRTAVRNVSLC